MALLTQNNVSFNGFLLLNVTVNIMGNALVLKMFHDYI